MTSGIKYTNGDIVLLLVPFTNLKESKIRPVFVIAHEQDDIIVCAITSVLRNDPYRVSIHELENGCLPSPSQVRCTSIVTLEHSLVIKKLGHAKVNTKEYVRRALLQILTT